MLPDCSGYNPSQEMDEAPRFDMLGYDETPYSAIENDEQRDEYLRKWNTLHEKYKSIEELQFGQLADLKEIGRRARMHEENSPEWLRLREQWYREYQRLFYSTESVFYDRFHHLLGVRLEMLRRLLIEYIMR